MSLFERYGPFLASLPSRERYDHTDLLVPALQIAKEGALRVFYCPFDSENPEAKVIILGITPGWTQMEIACRTVRDALAAGNPEEDACRHAKLRASFAGSMRVNLTRMLDALDLPRLLSIQSSSDLFGVARSLLHTTSAFRYPVFVGTRNYTGTNPRPSQSPFLMDFAREILASELESIPNAVLVPLGRSVEEVLQLLAVENRVRAGRWLSGFPHPSGANGHRVRLFSENRESLAAQLYSILGKPEAAAQQQHAADGASRRS
ncbi:MAG: hypothetical protein HYT87_16370 [Nitrospirae bacterium]|nr:hypothetical protein [Nitrospirota bacterium]